MSDFEAGWHELISGRSREWWAPPARAALGALSGLYGGVVTGYRAGFDLGVLRTQRLPRPVIAVGNITVGGTGKTTTVRWLARRLLEWGVRPAILSYGYRAGKGAGEGKGGRGVTVVAGPEGIRVPVGTSGDEPQLLARSLPGVPVLIGRKRVLSGRRACEEFGIDVCLLDDGFQYWRLEKDLEIVLVSAANPFGYGRLLPRGMLREPLRALRRADAVIITHASWSGEAERRALRARLLKIHPGLVVAEAAHVPRGLRDAVTGERLGPEVLRSGRWAALSSLGSPESFERTLREMGAAEPLPLRFPDHHPYSGADLRGVRARVAAERLAGIVTTEKDSVKIAPEWLGTTRCCTLEIDLEFLDGQDAVDALLRSRIGAGGR